MKIIKKERKLFNIIYQIVSENRKEYKYSMCEAKCILNDARKTTTFIKYITRRG